MTALWITKCEKSGLQSAIGCGLQSETKWKGRQGLQSASRWITKCDRDYKVGQRLQSLMDYKGRRCNVNSFCFGPTIPFFGKFGPKNQNCLFMVKLGI